MPKLDPKAQTERKVMPTIHSEVSLPIYWLNEEWAVTRFGLESVSPGSSYWIDAPRLGLVRDGRAEWPAQMESKGWTDPRLFVEAFFKALEIHEVEHNFDRQQEEARAREAADEMVAWNEARRRRIKRSGNASGLVTIAEMTEDEEEMESLLAEGYVAPEFPQSCVDR